MCVYILVEWFIIIICRREKNLQYFSARDNFKLFAVTVQSSFISFAWMEPAIDRSNSVHKRWKVITWAKNRKYWRQLNKQFGFFFLSLNLKREILQFSNFRIFHLLQYHVNIYSFIKYSNCFISSFLRVYNRNKIECKKKQRKQRKYKCKNCYANLYKHIHQF